MSDESTESLFTDRTMVVSGGSRGIGLAIALGAARRGANVVLLAKTADPHPAYRAPCTPRSPRSRPLEARPWRWSATSAARTTSRASWTPPSRTSAASTSS